MSTLEGAVLLVLLPLLLGRVLVEALCCCLGVVLAVVASPVRSLSSALPLVLVLLRSTGGAGVVVVHTRAFLVGTGLPSVVAR